MATTEQKLPRGRMGAESIDKVLRQAAAARHTVIIDYVSSEGETKIYEVQPYSYRNEGRKFFGYDLLAKSIKGFKTEEIIRAEETTKSFEPKWPVELAVIS